MYTLVGDPCAVGFSGGKCTGGCEECRAGGVEVLVGAGGAEGCEGAVCAGDVALACCKDGSVASCGIDGVGTPFAGVGVSFVDYACQDI